MVGLAVSVVVAGLLAAALVPPVERLARGVLRVRDRLWAAVLLALSWLASSVAVVLVAVATDLQNCMPFVGLSAVFHWSLFGLIHPRDAVFVRTRQRKRRGIGGAYPYYLTRDAVGFDRVFLEWATSALLVWAAVTVTLLLVGFVVGVVG